MRTSIARLAAGTLVVLAACTGSPSSTSPSAGTSGSTIRLAVDVRDRAARGRTAAPDGMPHRYRRSGRNGGVRRGRQRVGARSSERRRQLPVRGASPGSVHVEPPGRPSTVERPRDQVDPRCAVASRFPASRCRHVVGTSHRQGRRLHLPERDAAPQDLPRDPASRRHHAGRPCALPERHLPPVRSRHRVRGRHGRRGRDLALVEPGRGSRAAGVRGRRDQVRRARLHRGRDHAALRGRARRRRTAPARDRPDGPHDQPGSVARGRRGSDLHDRRSAGAGRRPDRADGRGDVRGLAEPWSSGAGSNLSRSRTLRPGSSAGSTAARSSWRPTDAMGRRTWSRSTAGSPSRCRSSSGIEIAAARTPLSGFVPPLPAGIEEAVGGGVG